MSVFHYFLFTCVGLVVTSVFTLILITWLLPVFVLVLGKNKCLPPSAIPPENIFALTLSLSIAGAVFIAFFNAVLIPAAVIAIVFMTSFAAALYLRIMGGKIKHMEFVPKRRYIYTAAKPVKKLQPIYITEESTYSELPGDSGYYEFKVILHFDEGPDKVNIYTDREKKDKDIVKLVEKMGYPMLRLVFLRHEGLEVFHSVTLTNDWASILCGKLERLSDKGREWWRQLLLPTLKDDDVKKVTIDELRFQLVMFEEGYRYDIRDSPDIQSNIRGIRRLMEISDVPVKIMNKKGFEDFRDERFKKEKYKRDIKDENDVVTVTITESS